MFGIRGISQSRVGGHGKTVARDHRMRAAQSPQLCGRMKRCLERGVPKERERLGFTVIERSTQTSREGEIAGRESLGGESCRGLKIYERRGRRISVDQEGASARKAGG